MDGNFCRNIKKKIIVGLKGIHKAINLRFPFKTFSTVLEFMNETHSVFSVRMNTRAIIIINDILRLLPCDCNYVYTILSLTVVDVIIFLQY